MPPIPQTPTKSMKRINRLRGGGRRSGSDNNTKNHLNSKIMI